jgi:glycosyltransferase involved in cell wall biosynthesis
MKRLCILADYPSWLLPGMEHLPSSVGHATWLHMLHPHFATLADEFEIHWIVMTKGIAKQIDLEVDRQMFHLLPRKRKITAMFTAYIFETYRIRCLLEQLQPSMVHAWGTEDAYAMAAARISEFPVLFSLQGCITECLRVTTSRFLLRLLGFYERYALGRLKFVTGESDRACRNMLSINPRLTTCIVDYGVGNQFHQITRSLGNTPSIAFVGGLFAAKGITELVEVMKRPSLSGIRLDVWGSGPELTPLKACATNNVIFHGHASRQQVLATLSHTWALVIPTHCDTGPTIVKEARAAGVPVITTTAAGASQHVRHGVSGFIIEPKDLDALEIAILDICESQEHSLAMGNADLEATRIALNGETTIHKFRNIYQMLLAVD